MCLATRVYDLRARLMGACCRDISSRSRGHYGAAPAHRFTIAIRTILQILLGRYYDLYIVNAM